MIDDGRTDKRTDGWMTRKVCGWLDVLDGWIYAWMHEWMHTWMEHCGWQMYRCACLMNAFKDG